LALALSIVFAVTAARMAAVGLMPPSFELS
jgi:hypothetical protein